MYLAHVSARNFRIFGSGADDDTAPLCLKLHPGLNALVGENDGGKSAVVDAIRLCLGTTSYDANRFSIDDFHCSASTRALTLDISCRFSDVAESEAADLLQYLTIKPDGKCDLDITVRAHRIPRGDTYWIPSTTHTGQDGNGPALEGAARELVRATYLRPLRDAEAELRPGRGSRLARILTSHSSMVGQDKNDFDPETDKASTMTGIVKRAEHHLQANSGVQQAQTDVNTGYLSHLSFGSEALAGSMKIAPNASLRSILERLELSIAETLGDETMPRGLGYNNALFMSAELLLLGSRDGNALLLIEEPEAHLHPQLQQRVVDLLNTKAKDSGVQVLMTTHSPNLASSIPVEQLSLITKGRTFSLAAADTRLDESDYAFLRRFLDATKAGLFFGRAVAVVEGDAEALLLPAISVVAGCGLSKHGVEVVNVGHVGLFRYSRIFQRNDDAVVPVRVACIRDRDVVPDHIPEEGRKELPTWADLAGDPMTRHVEKLCADDHPPVKTFVADHWTFEYDLAAASWNLALIMKQAVDAARASQAAWQPADKRKETIAKASALVSQWQSDGRDLKSVAWEIFKPLRLSHVSKAITAQFAAQLLLESAVGECDLPMYLRNAFKYLAQ